MATLNQIAYGILESVKGDIGADNNIDIRKVKYDIKNHRALLIRNELNKNRTINPSIVQSLGCIDVKAVSQSSCCDGVGDCTILRSVDKIPSTIERHGNDTITRVGGTNIMSPGFSYVDYETAKVSGNGRFNRDVIFAFLLNDYMYLIQRSATISFVGISKINVMGVFNDPEEISKFTDCNGDSCFTEDSTEYPLSEWMITYITKELFALYTGGDAVAPTDESINNKESVINQRKK